MSSYHTASAEEQKNNMLNSSIVSHFWPPPNANSIQFQKRGEETDDGCSLLYTVDIALMCLLFPPLQISIHKGNSCIHMCLDYAMLPGDGEFFCGGEGSAEGIMGRRGGRGGAGRFLQLL